MATIAISKPINVIPHSGSGETGTCITGSLLNKICIEQDKAFSSINAQLAEVTYEYEAPNCIPTRFIITSPHFSEDIPAYFDFISSFQNFRFFPNIARYNYQFMFLKYRLALEKIKYSPTNIQNDNFIKILSLLSENIHYTSRYSIKISADNEIMIINPSNKGLHYIFVGYEPDDISYGFVGNSPGDYSSLHFSDSDFSLDKIITIFNS